MNANRFGRRIERSLMLIRFHQPSQFGWRLYRVLQRQAFKRLPEKLVFTPGKVPARWKPGAREAFSAIADHRISLWPGRKKHFADVDNGVFCFLNTRKSLLRDAEGGWHLDWNPKASRLWRFHLQCQEQLLEIAFEHGPDTAFKIIRSWLIEERHRFPLRDPDAWHPFCISRRLPVWFSLLSRYDPPSDLEVAIWQSIADQVAWLSRQCEWDLGGNHLLENLTAIYLATSFLELPNSNPVGPVERHVISQWNEQVLPSGEHVERSPTYHALMTVCALQCLHAAEYGASQCTGELRRTVSRMGRFIGWLRQPHGEMPILGDSARNETPDLEKLLHWVEAHSQDSAVVSVGIDYWAAGEAGNRILFDRGPLAFDSLPAHGHADLTQVVASIGSQDAIVDTGNFEYEPTPIRQLCRSTEAHNVMQLGTKQMCDVWSSFRMGRRGHPISRSEGEQQDVRWAAMSHDAYHHLAGRVVLAHQNWWMVIDWHDHQGDPVKATTRLHWHPEWDLIEQQPRDWQARYRPHSELQASLAILGPGVNAKRKTAEYFPNFGERIPNQVLEIQSDVTQPSWFGYRIGLSKPLSDAPEVMRDGHVLTVSIADAKPVVVCLHG